LVETSDTKVLGTMKTECMGLELWFSQTAVFIKVRYVKEFYKAMEGIYILMELTMRVSL